MRRGWILMVVLPALIAIGFSDCCHSQPEPDSITTKDLNSKALKNLNLRLFVDYKRPLCQAIDDCDFKKCYYRFYFCRDIRTTPRPNNWVEMKLFHFSRDMEIKEIIRKMAKKGFRPAELLEGLVFYEANQDKLDNYMEFQGVRIVILGSIWNKLRPRFRWQKKTTTEPVAQSIEYYTSMSSGTELDIRHLSGKYCYKFDWLEYFLAVRK